MAMTSKELKLFLGAAKTLAKSMAAEDITSAAILHGLVVSGLSDQPGGSVRQNVISLTTNSEE